MPTPTDLPLAGLVEPLQGIPRPPDRLSISDEAAFGTHCVRRRTVTSQRPGLTGTKSVAHPAQNSLTHTGHLTRHTPEGTEAFSQFSQCFADAFEGKLHYCADIQPLKAYFPPAMHLAATDGPEPAALRRSPRSLGWGGAAEGRQGPGVRPQATLPRTETAPYPFGEGPGDLWPRTPSHPR